MRTTTRRSRRCPHRSSWCLLKTSGEEVASRGYSAEVAASNSNERAMAHRAHTSSRGLLRPLKHHARDFLPNSSAFRRRSRSLTTVSSPCGWASVESTEIECLGSATAHRARTTLNGKYVNRSRSREERMSPRSDYPIIISDKRLCWRQRPGESNHASRREPSSRVSEDDSESTQSKILRSMWIYSRAVDWR